MKVVSIFLFILFCSSVSYSQDTLRQTNSIHFGTSETYVLHDNGAFDYWIRCQCTGATSRGIGTYVYAGRKLKFEFDSLVVPVSFSNCINTEHADSTSLFVYDALDSSEVDYYGVKETSSYWLDLEHNKIAKRNLPFEIIWIFYEPIEVKADNFCSAYEIYLTPKFKTVNKGTKHILKKNEEGYLKKEIYKSKSRKQKRHKSIYKFQFK